MNNDGDFTLLVGMGIFEGLNRHTYNILGELRGIKLILNLIIQSVFFFFISKVLR